MNHRYYFHYVVADFCFLYKIHETQISKYICVKMGEKNRKGKKNHHKNHMECNACHLSKGTY